MNCKPCGIWPCCVNLILTEILLEMAVWNIIDNITLRRCIKMNLKVEIL